jgi:hypothetical protein
MSTRYKGSILSSTAAASSSTAAYGLWKQSEVAQLILSVWPVALIFDPYWSSVSMLLHGDGTNGAQNNTFLDSSSNAFTITRNGAATQGTYSPFTATAPYSASVSGGSGYFDGTADFLSTPANAAYQFGTGDFTIECWVYLTATPTAAIGAVIDTRTGDTLSAYVFGIGSTLKLRFTYSASATLVSTSSVSVSTWQHIVVTRISGVIKFFINGVVDATTITYSSALNSSSFISIGGGRSTAVNTVNGYYLPGYISNLRIVKGTAVYTANFTPPTAPLTAISGTSLLLGFTNAGVIDNAMLNNLVTVGTSQITIFNYKYGNGSITFSGTGAWLTAPNITALQLSTGDFTIEGWVGINATGTAYGIVSKGAAATGWSVNITSGNVLQFSYTATALTGTTALIAGGWYYFAVVRSGSGTGNLKIYLNGTADATSAGAVTDNFNQTSILYVGASRTGTTPLNGYIDDLRITKGVARYTADFAAPQQAFPNQ